MSAMIYFKLAIYYLLYGFESLVVINIILSWFPMIYRFKFFRGMKAITDTYMEPFHGVLVLGMFDFTPIIGIILLELIISGYAFLSGLTPTFTF